MSSFAINGFGRIGRVATRIWFNKHKGNVDLAAINTSGSMDLAGWAHLLRHDTTYGKWTQDITIEELQGKDSVSDENPLLGYFIIADKKIPVLAQRDPGKIPWSDYGVNLVVEATGAFRTEESAKKHLHANGAKQVLLTAPGKGGEVETIVLGVTDTPEGKKVYTNESCTTQCTATVMAVLHNKFQVKKAFLSTIHSYTDDQKLQDGSHKDLRRTRAAAQNIIPTSTGAAKATTRALPELQGKFDGMAIRIPTITGSLIDVTAIVNQPVTVEQVNQAFEEASQSPKYKGIIAVSDEPLVSSDIIGREESAIFDLGLTQVIDGDLVKIFAWYDNEWGFTSRLIETVVSLVK